MGFDGHLLLTSPQVFDLPSTDEDASIGRGIDVVFLDEFWMIVSTPANAPVPEFTLFDTVAPRNHPAASRQFRVPSRYRDCTTFVHVDCDRCLGVPDRDRYLTVDPTQAIFVAELVSSRGPRVLLIVRMQTLFEHVRSATTDACVPWDVWGSGAVVLETPPRDGANCRPHPLVHGAHMIAVQRSTIPGADGSHHSIYTSNFSRRGWSVLPLCKEGSGVERRVAFKDGQSILLQENEEVDEWKFDSPSNGKIMYLVSRFRHCKSGGTLTPGKDDHSNSGTTLYVWELV